MKKWVWIIPLFLFATTSLHAQGGEVEGLIKGTKTLVTSSRSGMFRAKFFLSQSIFEKMQMKYDAQIDNLLNSTEYSYEEQLAEIEKLNEEWAPFLASLMENSAQNYKEYSNELLRERDPRFLQPLSAYKNLPPLFTPTERVEILSNPNTITPRFFREWSDMIEMDTGIPEEPEAMITALSSRLMQADVTFSKALGRHHSLLDLLAKQKISMEEYLQGVVNLQVRLTKLSERSAQDVADLVHLVNLYPFVYNDNLAMLAQKIDLLPVQTSFTTFIRRQLNIPARTQIRGFREEIPSEQSAERRPIGFKVSSSQDSPK